MRAISPFKLLRIAAAFLLFLVYGAGTALAADLKMRIVLINPSAEKSQSKSIKNYLPKEVTPKDVKDSGGLDIDYDNEQGAYYVYKNDIPLAPGETKTFEVVIADVWMVAEDKLQSMRARTDAAMRHLEGTVYFDSGSLIAKMIKSRIDDILKTQGDQTVSRQQHIAYYRDNVKAVEQIQSDIDRLEKMLVAVGGPPNLDLVEQSDINLKAPSSKTTWVIIFVILVFIMILGGAFYFTWQGQARMTENIFKREKDESFSEFKKPQSPPS